VSWEKDTFGGVKIYKNAKTKATADKRKKTNDAKKQAEQRYYDNALTATSQALAKKAGVQYNDSFRQATESYLKNQKVMDKFRTQSANESASRERSQLKSFSSFAKKDIGGYQTKQYNDMRKTIGLNPDKMPTKKKFDDIQATFNRMQQYKSNQKPTSNGVGSSNKNDHPLLDKIGNVLKKVDNERERATNRISNIMTFGAGKYFQGKENELIDKLHKKDKGSLLVKRDDFSSKGRSTAGKVGDFVSDSVGYLGAGGAIQKGLKGTKLAANVVKNGNKLKNLTQIAKEGASVGGIISALETPMKKINDHESTKDTLKRVGLEVGLGGVGDVALHGVGHLISKLGKKATPELTKEVKTLIKRDAVKGKTSDVQLLEKLKLPKKEQVIKPSEKIASVSIKEHTHLNIDSLPKQLDPRTAPLAEKIIPVNDHIPYKPGDPLPDTQSHIDTKTKKNLLNIKEIAKKGYIKGIDNLHSLNQFDKTVESVLGRKLKPTESTYTLGLNSRGSDQISKQILTEKMVDKNGEVVGNSLKDIASQIPKNKEKLFEDYLINKHAITRMNRGEKVFPDEMKMNAAKSEAKVLEYEKQHPEFKDLANQYYEYNKQLGEKWLVDTGILSKDQWKGYLEANPHYVPNQRIFDSIERPTFSNGAKKGFAGQTNPIKKGVGSQRKIVSPLESTIEHTDKYIKTAKRNEVMQTFIHNISQDPEAFKGIAEIVPTKDTPTDIMDTIHKNGVDGLMDELNAGFDQKPDLSKGNVVTGIIDGQKVHVRVHDPELLDSITNLAPKAQHTVVKAVGQLTRWTKNLTTGINPVFSLTRNIFRDIPTAYINSKTTNNPVVFGKDLVGSLVSVLKNDDLYRSFKAVGGGHSSPISSDVNLLAQSKNEILGKNNLKSLLSKGIGKIENLNNALESAPRLAEYKRITKNGTSYDAKMKGLFEANDVTVNFNKYGNVGKEVDAFIPYMNAALQGLDKTVRIFKDNPVKASVKAFTAITIPSIVLYTINHKDPNYQNLSDYVKDNNFLIPKGDGTFIKIPKPRELGVLFGSDVERTLRAWNDHDPEAFAKFSDTIQDNFYPPTRTILHPVLKDLPSNKNFNNAPIVPGDLQNLSPRYQYDGRTSEPAKFIGNLTNISPKKLDYLAQSYGGVVSELGVPLTTKGGSIGDTLKQKVTADPTFSNDALRNFYDEKTKLDQAHNDYVKQGIKSKELNEPLRLELNRRSRQIGDIRKIMKQVQNNNSISDKERNDKVKKLQEQINNLAKMPRR
jgi:hypothetical protein